MLCNERGRNMMCRYIARVYFAENMHGTCTLLSIPILCTRQLYFRMSVKLSNTGEGLCSRCSVIQEVQTN